MTVSGGRRAVDDGPGIERQLLLKTASRHRATEGHTQRGAVGVKHLAAGVVWRAVNNGRRAAGS
jgi:hypothetical protein